MRIAGKVRWSVAQSAALGGVLCGALCLALWLLLLHAAPARAQIDAGTVITVTSLLPANEDACTLRAALTAANQVALVNQCDGRGGAPYTIVLASGAAYALFTVDNIGEYSHSNGLPIIHAPITIAGNGATIERAPVPRVPLFRLFEVAVTGTLRLHDVTLRGGSQEDGGAVMNFGNLELVNSTLTGNGSGCGGAIDNAGTLVVEHSAIIQNMADG
jgi:hypothetical protein